VVIEQKSLQILTVEVGQGREHDFNVCKRSQHARKLNAKTELVADSGFQGVKKIHAKSRTPFKGSKKHPLTDEQRAFNRKLASERIVVEHVIRRLKVFRVLKEVYRHRCRRFGLRAHLLAGLYNADLVVK
jgi:IS5 family transposase